MEKQIKKQASLLDLFAAKQIPPAEATKIKGGAGLAADPFGQP